MLLTVQKIGPVLDLFTIDRPEWGVTEVADRLGVAKSSAHALLVSLAGVGLLSSTSQSRYRLGWRFLDLGETLKASLNLRGTALPLMRALVAQHRETVQLAVLDRGRVLFIERVEGTHPVRFAGAPVGARWPGHANAAGKALMAVRPRGEVARIVSVEGMRAMTPNTITDLDDLHAELAEVRRVGYACDVEECVPGVSGVAAPVRAERGATVAALCIAVPTSRFETQEAILRQAVVSAAATMSRELRRVTAEERDSVADAPARDVAAADAALRRLASAAEPSPHPASARRRLVSPSSMVQVSESIATP
jgi:DNA-binding IclR family transcriptional regulator